MKHFHVEWVGDGTWRYIIGKEIKTGFTFESHAILAAQERIKQMDSLEMELIDVRKSIANLLFGPQPFNEIANKEHQEQLESLYAREGELEKLLDQESEVNYQDYL